MIGCNDGKPVRPKVDLDLSSRGLFKPNLTLLHHHFNLKIARFLCSSDFPNMGFNPKIPKLKRCCKVTTMETVVSGQLTAVLSRGATGLQSQSLDLPEFDDQSTFAAKNFPTKRTQKAVFSDSFVFTQIRPNGTTELHKGVFFPCPKSPSSMELMLASRLKCPATEMESSLIQFVGFVTTRNFPGVFFFHIFGQLRYQAKYGRFVCVIKRKEF